LQAAYNELWNEASLKKTGKEYEFLSAAEKREIRSGIPLVLSEAEPTAFGEEGQ
jgi:hypothetical protein